MNTVPEATDSLTRKTIIGATWLLLWRIVSRSLGLVSTLVLARLLLPADFGLVAMATTFSAGVEALSQLGLQDALVRRREEGLDLHHTAFTLQLGRAIVTAVAIAAGATTAAWWFAEPRLEAIMFVLAGVTVLNGLENVGMAEYRRVMRFDIQFRALLATRLAGFLTTIVCALIWNSYWALLGGIVVSNAVRVAISYWMHPFRPRLQLTRWRELGRFSLWIWATAIATLIWDRCDPFLLGPAFGPAKLGVYLLALEVSLLPVTEIIGPAADALFTAFARAQKEGTSSVHHAPEAAGIILLVVAPIVLSISAASGPIVEVLLGAKWASAWPIVSALTWACVFSPYSFICTMALVANGYVKRNFAINVIMSSIKLAALATTIALTKNPVVIGMMTTACVGVEAILFMALLRGTGTIRLRPALGGAARAVAGIAVAALVIGWSGLGWQEGTGATGSNLVRGFMIGGMSAGVFGLTVLSLWQLADRPAGPEGRLSQLVGTWFVSSKVARWAGLKGCRR